MKRSLSLFGSAALLAGCNSGGATGTADACAAPCPAYQSTANLTTPTVSFKSDVMPIFEQSCGLSSSCHGAGAPEVFLGSTSDADAGAVIAGIVNQSTAESKTMPIVAPGNPGNSFLMHKIDWDLCSIYASCTEPTGDPCNPCGSTMPQTNTLPLDVATRDTIRRWIAQGAQNN